MGIKSKAVVFTRAETEALMILMHHSGISSIDPKSIEKEQMKIVCADLPISARSRIVTELNRKIWEVWADTHPEEGPFK